jgi:hypothetical protein
MTAGGSALHVTGTGSAFLADLYDCLRDLTLPGAVLLAAALDPSGWSAVIDTLAICPDLSALLVGRRPPAGPIAFARAEPRRLPVRDAAAEVMLLGVAALSPQPLRGVFDEARRVLRPGACVLIASPGAPTNGRKLAPHNAVAVCRLLEEHGFSVEKTLTSRQALSHARGERSASVLATSLTRDRILARHAWESLIVQARRW